MSERKSETRKRILAAAGRVLAERGPGDPAVAEVMAEAGLTVGGFYAHFASREALLAEALERAGEDSQVRLRRALDAGEAKGGSRFQALVDNYLADRHLRSPESGCPVAALASEMPRQPDPVREAAAARIEALTRTVAATLAPAQAREAAGVIASQLVGALQIARTLGDNAKGRRHLAASRRFLLEQFAPDNPNTPPDTTH